MQHKFYNQREINRKEKIIYHHELEPNGKWQKSSQGIYYKEKEIPNTNYIETNFRVYTSIW